MLPPRLWNFQGGLAPDGLVDDPALPPLAIPPLPHRLIFPLQQIRGQVLKAVVEPGQHVLKGQILAESDVHPPLHASSSGEIQAIQHLPLPYPSSPPGDCLVLLTDGEDAAITVEPNHDPQPTAEALLRRIWQAGIVGLGGAGFSTADKLNAGLAAGIDTLIINGAECEPLISCDQTLLTHFPHKVLAGAQILCRILGIKTCLLAIEADKLDTRNALEIAITQGEYTGIKWVRVPPQYPTGSERQLIQVLTGREIPHGQRPSDLGIACLNVATVAAVYEALEQSHPLISRWITVTGTGLHQPMNLMARIGTPIADLIAYCGGYRTGAERLIMGGAMMGYPLASDALPVVKSTQCLWIAGPGEWTEAGKEQPCIRCGSCAEVCPVGLLPQQLYRQARGGEWEQLMAHHLDACIACGCCDVVCPSHIPLVQQFMLAQKQLVAQQEEQARAQHAKMRYEARLTRKAREAEERIENARRRKESLDKDKTSEIQGALARLKAKRQTG